MAGTANRPHYMKRLILLAYMQLHHPEPKYLDVTTMGCEWRGNKTPTYCGPRMLAQGNGELRQLREHIRREVRVIKRGQK